MNKDGAFIPIFLFVLVAGAAIGGCCVNDYWEQSAVKHGCASYNSQTGHWQWNNKGEEK